MKAAEIRKIENKILTKLNEVLDRESFPHNSMHEGLEALILCQELLDCCEEDDEEGNIVPVPFPDWYPNFYTGDPLPPVSTTGDIPA